MLTATPKTIKIIAELRGVTEDKITVIEKKTAKPRNHLVKVVTENKGIKSNQWSEQALERMRRLITETIEFERIPKDKVLIHAMKEHIQHLNLDYIKDSHFWSGTDRGSNLFSDIEYQFILGTPNQNKGAAKAHYFTLFGTLKGFDNYYKELIQNDILQNLGRLRAILRPSEKIETLIAVKDLDPQFIADYGYSVEVVDLMQSNFSGYTLTKKQYQLRNIITNLPTHLCELKESLSLKNLAQFFDLDIKQFSKYLKELGLNMSIIKKLYSTLQALDFKNSPKPIEILREKCEFIPDWFKSRLINYFSLMQSHQKIPFWELSLDELSLNLNKLIYTGWIFILGGEFISQLCEPPFM